MKKEFKSSIVKKKIEKELKKSSYELV